MPSSIPCVDSAGHSPERARNTDPQASNPSHPGGAFFAANSIPIKQAEWKQRSVPKMTAVFRALPVNNSLAPSGCLLVLAYCTAVTAPTSLRAPFSVAILCYLHRQTISAQDRTGAESPPSGPSEQRSSRLCKGH